MAINTTFKNVSIFSFNPSTVIDHASLELKLKDHIYQPCTPEQTQSLGWKNVLPRDEALTFPINDHLLLTAMLEEKPITAAIIKHEVDRRIAAEDHHLSKEERVAIRASVLADFQPRAFSRHKEIHLLIMAKQGILIVDTPNLKKAQLILNLLGLTLTELNPTNLQMSTTPTTLMTNWINTQTVPEGFKILDEAEFTNFEDSASVLRFRKRKIFSKEIVALLDNTQIVTELELMWKDKIRFIMNEPLSLKNLDYSKQLDRSDFSKRAIALSELVIDLFSILNPNLSSQRAEAV